MRKAGPETYWRHTERRAAVIPMRVPLAVSDGIHVGRTGLLNAGHPQSKTNQKRGSGCQQRPRLLSRAGSPGARHPATAGLVWSPTHACTSRALLAARALDPAPLLAPTAFRAQTKGHSRRPNPAEANRTGTDGCAPIMLRLRESGQGGGLPMYECPARARVGG